MSEDKEKIKSLEILVSASRSKVDYLLNADNALDSKAGVMIALEGAVLTYYLSNLQCTFLLSTLSLTTMVLSSYFLWKILNTKEYNTGVVDFYDDSKGYRSMSVCEVLNRMLSDYQKAFDDNSLILSEKNKNYNRALRLFLASLALMIVIYFI